MHAAICLETCQFPDAINKIGRPGFPTRPFLEKGETYKQTTIHKKAEKIIDLKCS
jgi:galactose mutarotase-like enzyme